MIYTFLSWVRRIEKFNVTHIFADFIIFVSVVTIIVFACLYVAKFDWNPKPEFIDSTKFMNIIGFSVFAYEGIGTVIPIMEITENKEAFPKVLILCLSSVFLVYLAFGEICYFSFG